MMAGFNAVAPMACVAAAAIAAMIAEAFSVQGERMPIAPLGVIGFSHGGWTVLAAMFAPRESDNALAEVKREGFAAAVALYHTLGFIVTMTALMFALIFGAERRHPLAAGLYSVTQPEQSVALLEDKMAKLAVDVFRPGDGVGDLGAQQFAETLPEPMHRHFHGSLRQIQLMADLGVRS
jgi:hypothetical protein